MARAHCASSPDSAARKREDFGAARTKRSPQRFAATPRRAFAASLGAALPRGAQHAAGARLGAGLRARAAMPRSAARRATATSSSRRSIFRRAFPMPRRASSPRAAASVRCGVAVRGDRRAPATRVALRIGRRTSRRSPPRSSPSDRISSPAAVGGDGALRGPRGASRSRRSPPSRTNRSRRSTLGSPRRVPFARPDASPRRCARSVGVRPQRRAGTRCAAGRDEPGRGGHQRQRTARRARPRDARARTSKRSCGDSRPTCPRSRFRG